MNWTNGIMAAAIYGWHLNALAFAADGKRVSAFASGLLGMGGIAWLIARVTA